MNQRSEYLKQIIEKIGGPLLAAIQEVAAKNPASAGDAAADAQRFAELLSKTVQLSIELGKVMEIEKANPDQVESIRVAAAALAGPMVAAQYSQNGKVPSEQDLTKLSGTLETVMTFSDNYPLSAENLQRLKEMDANGKAVDTHQTNIQFLQAFTPVADAVATFSFGQAEKKMMQDIADKIHGKSKEICESVFGKNLDEGQRKLAELAILKSLTDIYTECHKTEVTKLMALQDPGADAQSKAITSLWQNFDLRAGILESLAENMGLSSSKTSPAPAAPPATPQQPPVEPPPQASAAPPPSTPQAPPAQETSPPAAPPAGNPMSMFAKPKDDNAAAPAAPPAQPQQQPPAEPPPQAPATPPPLTPQAPPAQETPPPAAPPAGNPMSMFAKPKDDNAAAPTAPPAQPQQQPPIEPPPQAPATPPPPTEPPAQEQPPEQNQQPAGNPMSFFKTPPKGEDEE